MKDEDIDYSLPENNDMIPRDDDDGSEEAKDNCLIPGSPDKPPEKKDTPEEEKARELDRWAEEDRIAKGQEEKDRLKREQEERDRNEFLRKEKEEYEAKYGPEPDPAPKPKERVVSEFEKDFERLDNGEIEEIKIGPSIVIYKQGDGYVWIRDGKLGTTKMSLDIRELKELIKACKGA